MFSVITSIWHYFYTVKEKDIINNKYVFILYIIYKYYLNHLIIFYP